MKILSNEQLVISYRDAVKSGKEQESVARILKEEITKRGLKPFKKKK
ncbi:sporulation inhibitor A family protein [Pseudoneobacillus sp. C159]